VYYYFTHLVNTIHSFSQDCLFFSFLSRKLCVIFLLARFYVTSFTSYFSRYNCFIISIAAIESSVMSESTIWVFKIFSESIARMEMMQLIQSSLVIILTSYNYFEWKPKAAFQLKRKGLYNLMMATETKPTSMLEKTRWANRKDEATRLQSPLIYGFMLSHARLQTRFGPPWKESLERRMRCEVICLR
jgi:hypothetical protein